MLTHLHVKNLALIREAEIDFTEGLNILTGETGAGKSILIGSVSLALGEKQARDMVKAGEDFGLSELLFEETDGNTLERLSGLGIDVSDGEILISRKISGTRSINKINGQTVTLGMLKKAASLLIDVHGQHEHQSLLGKKKQLEILDDFAGEGLAALKETVSKLYRRYTQLKSELEEASLDSQSRLREISLLEYEINEIESAAPTPGEDAELETLYQKMSNAAQIRESVFEAYSLTGYDNGAGGSAIGRALQKLQSAAAYDESLGSIVMQLNDIDSLLNDFNREISDYTASLEFDDEEFDSVGKRLDTLNSLKAKYGRTLEDVLEYRGTRRERLNALENYDQYIEGLKTELAGCRDALERACAEMSALRKDRAVQLSDEIKRHLEDLNFLNCDFRVEISRLDDFTASGFDDVEFLISTNPGSPPMPLNKTASGGELSRIMLAVKTVLAEKDDTGTVIFDEIDAGISGRTAQKVAEKLQIISRSRQVICITHLAQIAAMADTHFCIEKSADDGGARTDVKKLDEAGRIEELSRMLGGASITEAVRNNAAEMRGLAEEIKRKGPI